MHDAFMLEWFAFLRLNKYFERTKLVKRSFRRNFSGCADKRQAVNAWIE